MPNGQRGEGWQYLSGQDLGSVELRYTPTEIQQRRESMEQRMQRRREADRERTAHLQSRVSTIRPGETVRVEQGTYMAGGSFTVDTSNWSFGSFDYSMWATPPPPKRKRPIRPVSAIFYTLVNECGY